MPKYEVELSTIHGSVRTSCTMNHLDLDQAEEALRQKILAFPPTQRESLLACIDRNSMRIWCEGRMVWSGMELGSLEFEELKTLRQTLQQQLDAVIDAMVVLVEKRLAELEAEEEQAKADLEQALALQARAEARLRAIAEERAKLKF